MISYDFDSRYDRIERMTLLTDKDYDAYFEALDKLTDERMEVAHNLLELAQKHGCIAVRPMRGYRKSHTYCMYPSLYDEGYMQYSSFDAYGPICHQTIWDEGVLENELPGSFTVTI